MEVKILFKEVSVKDKNALLESKKIIEENHVLKGGTLEGINMVYAKADYLICAYKGGEIVGFASLVKNQTENNDLYISMIAFKKDYQHKGIGKALCKRIFSLTKGFSYVTAHVREENKGSQKLFESLQFSKKESKKKGVLLYFYDTSKIKNARELKDFGFKKTVDEKNIYNFV